MQIIADEHVGDGIEEGKCDNEEDEIYNAALRHAINAIDMQSAS